MAGKMSIARGVLQSGVHPPQRISTAVHSNPNRRIAFETFGVGDCVGVVGNILAFGEWAGHRRFIRVMPNTPSAIGEAATVMSLGGAETEEDGELISKLFGSVGKVWQADEKLFDGITGLSGSGPAYIFLAIEALVDGGVAAGLPRELALGLASQTVS
ncbi:hypothetical protein Patl1_22887 [Pistacia atlantica]|uniref:Uncharacterized protein n=1 Tax=Pistacia atlantica TaxID=434234 RepID=A0ACC0ZZH3_9ROSI|nr:hypothetical protein Patl1_22887 [Pistacia atlantica]